MQAYTERCLRLGRTAYQDHISLHSASFSLSRHPFVYESLKQRSNCLLLYEVLQLLIIIVLIRNMILMSHCAKVLACLSSISYTDLLIDIMVISN